MMCAVSSRNYFRMLFCPNWGAIKNSYSWIARMQRRRLMRHHWIENLSQCASSASLTSASIIHHRMVMFYLTIWIYVQRSVAHKCVYGERECNLNLPFENEMVSSFQHMSVLISVAHRNWLRTSLKSSAFRDHLLLLLVLSLCVSDYLFLPLSVPPT